jgi:hypothetical protein
MLFNEIIEFGLCKKFEGSFIIKCYSFKLIDKKKIDNFSLIDLSEQSILSVYEKDHEILIEQTWNKRLNRTFKCMKVKDPSHKFDIVLDLSKPMSNLSFF